MADREQIGVMDSTKPNEAGGGIGVRITQSFQNRADRMRQDANPMLGGSNIDPTESVSRPLTSERTPSMPPAKARTPKIEVKSVSSRPKTSRSTRRARLRISRVDPWSVMKTALLFGVAAWIMMIIATFVVFTVLELTGLYDAINETVKQIFASPNDTDQFQIRDYINTTRATALSALVGAVNVVIVTALATIFAFLYNLSAVVMGGIEVTMAED
ncbi:MAG: DUF3566 domain-containing protein [Propionibacteriaceae bacterium]|nr:DUF3566 domain-containing protein [Propionibacteriaceae bacterium]